MLLSFFLPLPSDHHAFHHFYQFRFPQIETFFPSFVPQTPHKAKIILPMVCLMVALKYFIVIVWFFSFYWKHFNDIFCWRSLLEDTLQIIFLLSFMSMLTMGRYEKNFMHYFLCGMNRLIKKEEKFNDAEWRKKVPCNKCKALKWAKTFG